MSGGGWRGRRVPVGPLQVVAAAPPARAALAGAAAAPFVQALEGVRLSGGPFLAVRDFQPAACMDLVLDFEEAAASGRAGLTGPAGSAQRARWLEGMLDAAYEQHGDWLVGMVKGPGRHQLASVSCTHWLVQPTADARAKLVQAVRSQSITVQVDGEDWRVPAAAAMGRLPPGQQMLLVSGLDADCCREGVVEALLSAAGYSAELGISVVHERAGRVAGGAGGRGVPALDRVVAVVQVPAAHAGLPRLPECIDDGYEALHIEVRRRVVPRGRLVVRRSAPPPPPPPPRPDVQGPMVSHPGVRRGMDRVYAAAGVTPEVRAGAACLAVGGVGRAAVPPGVRSGLGFAPAAGAAPAAAAGAAGPAPGAAAATAAAGAAGSAAAAAAPARAAPAEQREQPVAAAAAAGAGADALPPGDADMPDLEGREVEVPAAADVLMLPALPSREPPLDEPGYGAACQLVSESTDASPEQIQQIVMQARSVDPAAYRMVCGAARPSELTRPFRMALHAQARVVLGEEDAGGLAVSWEGDAAEDEAWQGPLGAQAGRSAPQPASASPCARPAAAAAAAQPATHAGSRPGPSSPAVGGCPGASGAVAGELRAGARTRRPTSTPSSNSWLGMQAAALGRADPAPVSGRGHSRGRSTQ